ncbi:MAG: iron chelate uptake ABC transporter family permease subunit [Firmicutes bacterium]|nr:iron chelate uptake ABC transporter family permease subunit [Bacillota bacterium]
MIRIHHSFKSHFLSTLLIFVDHLILKFLVVENAILIRHSAVAVCTCGIVGFVGLMVPHIVRGFVGSDHRFLLPIAALSGGIFLIWTDVLARVVMPNSEIPIGVITSAIGAPIFVYMMIKKSYGFGGGDR